MRVVQVAPRYPPHTGGVETHVREISERLVERGHEVVVHAADASDNLRACEERNGVRVYRHRSVSPDGAFHVAPAVATGVRRARADVVHAHNYHSFPLAFAALGANDARFVATPHYHGASADALRDRLLAAYRPIGRRALDRADAVVAVSDWERRQLRDDLGTEARVIPNGIDVARFRDATPARRDRPYLLTVGRLEEYKGVQNAVRTLRELSDYTLLVAGTGPYRDELERTARRCGVANRVTFLGYVSDDSLPGLYAGAEVHLALSEFEAYGMTVAEALAAGTPCVVREAAALADWVGERGVVGTRVVDPKGVADAVRSARTVTPDVELLGWDGVTDRLVEVYTS